MIADVKAHLSKDARLKTIIDTVELDYQWQPEVQGDVLAYLLRAIIGQQVSIQAAAAIHKRFLDLFEHNSPDAGTLKAMDETVLRGVGLSKQKISYVKNVSAFFLEHGIQDMDWQSLSDETIVTLLTRIKGVGQWTVEIMLMFCLNRGDVFPIDDLGIQHTMIRLYNLEGTGKSLKQQLEVIATPWRPYRTLACYYLWSWKHRW